MQRNLRVNLITWLIAVVISALLMVSGFADFFRKSMFNQNVTPYLGSETSLELYSFLTSEIDADYVNKQLDDNILIVDITYADRKQIAEVIDKVEMANPHVIGIDVRFMSPKDSTTDAHLIKSINKENIVLPVTLDTSVPGGVTGSFFNDDIECPQKGYVNFYDSNNRVRDFFSISDSVLMKSFSLSLAQKADSTIMGKDDFRIINFLDMEFEDVNFEAVLSREFELHRFDDKIVLLGGVYDLSDVHRTYAGDKQGIVMHAHAISNLFHDSFIKECGRATSFIISLILSLLIVVVDSVLRCKGYFKQVFLTILEVLFMYGLVFFFAIIFRKHHLLIDPLFYFILITVYLLLQSMNKEALHRCWEKVMQYITTHLLKKKTDN